MEDTMTRLSPAAIEDAIEEAVATTPHVASSPAPAGPLPPGSIVGGKKKPWTERDVKAISPMVTFFNHTPYTTMVFNGVRFNFASMAEITVPAIIKARILETYNENNRIHADSASIRGVTVTTGALEPKDY
jgi:hypothetical protein